MADQTSEAAFRQQVAEHYSALKQEVLGIEVDVENFSIKDNSAAGTRVRKSMQVIKDLGQRIREAVQAAKGEDQKAKEAKK
jgi:spore germination protein YaaH